MPHRLILPLVLGFLLTVVAARHARAETLLDTPENRQVQAHRYLEATPLRQMFSDMTKKMSANVPDSQRAQVAEMLTTAIDHMDMDAVSKGMEEVLVKHFTAEELQAMADFYGSPIGKSVLSKMGDYTADLMPLMQAQMLKPLSGNSSP